MATKSVGSMRAARIVAPGRISIEQVPIPLPQPNQVRIRIQGCGVCGSNLGPWRGLPWQTYPLAPGQGGHEAWGVIDALGHGVEGLHLGTRVAALCYAAFAQYDVAEADHVVALPASLHDRPFAGEPLGCAMNIYQRSRLQPGQTVAIVGIGFLGSLLCRLASQAGARVLAISRRPFALQMARAMGASETIALDDPKAVVERVRIATQGALCDCVIEAAGHQATLDLAAELTAERGTLVIAGYHQDGPRQVNLQLWNWRGLDVVNAHERDPRVYVQGMRAAVHAIVYGGLQPWQLLTHSFPLERLDEALQATDQRPGEFMKAFVTP